MKFSNSIKWSSYIFAFIAVAFFSSCTDNSSLIDTEEEPLETGMDVTIGNRSVSSNAFAKYCEDTDLLVISNNLDLLENPVMNTGDWEADDFIIYKNLEGSQSVVAGAGFVPSNPDVSLAILLGVDNSELNITNQTSELVEGDMTGVFFFIYPDGTPEIFNYSVNFVADILDDPDYCN